MHPAKIDRISAMLNTSAEDAATAMAAGRTAYSLAREVLGLRAQVAELRDTLASMEAEEGQEITALRQELEVAIEIAGQVEPLQKDNRDLRREVAAWRGA